jgi:protein gp37
MVFVNSMSDMFHEQVPDSAVAATFAVMAAAKQHQFQMLTKRSERMLEWFRKLKTDLKDPYKILEHCEAAAREYGVETEMPGQWPARNVWLGVSVEDAKRKFRIDDLRQTPAVIRFLSAEPLLGDLGDLNLEKIHWVIVGGESGPGSRPMDIEWARNIRNQCFEKKVAFFMKQWGQFDSDGVKHRSKKETGCNLDGVDWKQWPKVA